MLAHHSGCAFTGNSWYYGIGNYYNSVQSGLYVVLMLEQAFCMSLFFFLAGNGIPNALVKQGPRVFLQRAALQLGVPYLAYFFALGPALMAYVQYIQLPAECHESSPGTVARAAGKPEGWWVLDSSSSALMGEPKARGGEGTEGFASNPGAS